MTARLIATAVLALSTAPLVVAATPAAQAAEACTPVVSVRTPTQDASGFVTFAADFSVCQTTRIKVKYRDRNTTDGWLMGAVTYPGGSTNTLSTGECRPDGREHRWVAYATLKVDGNLIAQTAKVYFKARPVTTCGTWSVPREASAISLPGETSPPTLTG
jgi:hypothetical protein